MTPAFWCIVIAIFMNYLLAGLGGWLTTQQTGRLDIRYPRLQAQSLTGMAARVNAAQANSWEILTAFACSVFIAHLAGVPASQSALPAYLFIASRILYCACYTFNLIPWRTVVFVVGIFACLWLIKMAASYSG